MCQSGFGILLDKFNATCVELTNITSNIDGHVTGLNLATPQVALQTFKTCNLSYVLDTKTKPSVVTPGCRYFFANSTPIPEVSGDRTYSFTEHCECTLRNSISAIDTNGICFLPHGSVMKKYVDSIKYSLKNGAS
jgi:hypothetical protein